MLKKLIMAAAGLVLVGSTATIARAESALDFKLVNKTGYGIKAIHIAPSASKQWGDNIITESLGTARRSTSRSSPRPRTSRSGTCS
jgi:hypothetical protein